MVNCVFDSWIAYINDLESFAEGNLDRLLILDEVQRKPSLFFDLRSVIDRNRQPGRFILLGSASLELIRDASKSRAGRIAILELSGFTLDELAGVAGYTIPYYRTQNGAETDAVLVKGGTVRTPIRIASHLWPRPA
ncbi:AAA family ATPase [Neolewinella sp.]|uniref:AAA family ATPase n=1 Tax=Neolewinella sp. TaxID=2993543 RepID=UPI003B524614